MTILWQHRTLLDRKWHECDWMDGRAMVDECCFYLGSRFLDYYACVYTILLRACLPFFSALFSKIFRSRSSHINLVTSERQPLFFGVKRERSSLFGGFRFRCFRGCYCCYCLVVLLSCCVVVLLSCRLVFFFFCFHSIHGFLIHVCLRCLVTTCMLKMYRTSRKQSINQSINQSTNFYYTLKTTVYICE